MSKVKVRRKKMEPVYHFSHILSPNDVWCADFKGHFTVGDGMRCTPLTITDAYSRFLLGCEIVSKANTESVITVFTKLFTEYGYRVQFGPITVLHLLLSVLQA
ncbi:DDE-type integrase/transposase/recombinase [Leptospira borgpetersenii serovar Ballum]|nr:DDE-type integrase/transposase/recombinase [Leptospira borgpetersenii]MBE8162343.1 DDE-type integrase/transposase/recombinase [Leptospira borgpetersenii serovar Ballum]MBE8172068.1 DDE-type integrase/transposase/recombinase [Leptospira borgpetersenii serovar Ballum]MBE8186308.1 DDE-type integrase/transposase/recombinase [Leptospira borgpetersenii serovar Ballum]MBE8198158.1 DDE-type integrase/transposase/recombinase [Leptospira borgpetersenii serovar Ballum]MBE8204572.1 DDE-type integrase/t